MLVDEPEFRKAVAEMAEEDAAKRDADSGEAEEGSSGSSPTASAVISAKAGTHSAAAEEGARGGSLPEGAGRKGMDPRLRGADEGGEAEDVSPAGRGEAHAHAAKPLPYDPEPAEAALIEALGRAVPAARAAVAEERFEEAMQALAELRAPVDRFFDEVTVNDEDEVKRAERLKLLAQLRNAAHEVADFSKIEG